MRYQYRKCTFCGRTITEKPRWNNPGEPVCVDYDECLRISMENNLEYYDMSRPSTEEMLWPEVSK